MATVLLFHHALGQTPGFLAFADELPTAGHAVDSPDLYDGRTFTKLDAGVAHAEEVGMMEIVARGKAAAAELSQDIVYAGFSLGALPAQALAQTRPGAKGAILLHGGVATSWFDSAWPDAVPLEIHTTQGDPWSEMDVLEQLASEAAYAELFVYPGSGHLFAEVGGDEYDEGAAGILKERVLAFLDRVGSVSATGAPRGAPG